MKYTKIKLKSWAVQLTWENRNVVKEYFKQHCVDFNRFNYDGVSSLYGIDIHGNLQNHCNFDFNKYDKILSNKEFTQLITDKEQDYEIY